MGDGENVQVESQQLIESSFSIVHTILAAVVVPFKVYSLRIKKDDTSNSPKNHIKMRPEDRTRLIGVN